MGSKNPHKSTAIFEEDLQKEVRICLKIEDLSLNFVEEIALVLWLFVANNQLFACWSELLLVDVLDQAGTLHATGVEIRLILNT